MALDGVASDALYWTIKIAQYSTSAVFILFLSHKLLMLIVYPFVTRKEPVAGVLPEPRPFVTVQLPCFNESAVIRRVIDSACGMDWPKDRFEVHVLDDSNDETTMIAQDAAAYWRSVGVQCRVIRRPMRTGYKAGALQWDIDQEVHPESRFFPVFDADFAPAADWLQTAMAYFYDTDGTDRTDISMVQGRWSYLNANANLLTRLQEVVLSGHFFIEQVFRSRTNRPWNFNGTAGVWRRAAIAAVGGWEHDTIVEDSDLSIKCFDAGFRGIFVRDLQAPSELPTSIADYRSQQTRWIKGFGQLFAKKAVGAFTSRNTSLVHKVEFFFHTLPSLCYAATVVFQLYFPLAVFVNVPFSWAWLGVNLGALAIFWGFYSLTLYRTLGFWRGFAAQWRIPAVMVLCWGMAPLLASAFVQGIFSSDATFTRTPKRAATADESSSSRAAHSVPGASESTIPSVSGGTQAQPAMTGTAVPVPMTMAAPATVPEADRGTLADPSLPPPPPHREHSAAQTSVTDGVACRTFSDETQATAISGASTVDDDDKTDSPASASASSSAVGTRASGASYFTTKLSPLPLVEAAMAGWSAFAAVAAVFGLASAPLHQDWTTGALWLVAVLVFCTGSAVGLGWNSVGALAGMARGLGGDFVAATAAATRLDRRGAAAGAPAGAAAVADELARPATVDVATA
ncbi:hypothetical protein MMPV_005203 [Pyropia vietnamensis]